MILLETTMGTWKKEHNKTKQRHEKKHVPEKNSTMYL
jgi:hypothetical protein